MNKTISLLAILFFSMSCRTAKVHYVSESDSRSDNVALLGSKECLVNGDKITADFPNQANCVGKIWDYQRKTCASHIPLVNCVSFTDIINQARQITSSTGILNDAKNKGAKILACGQRETSNFKDFTVQVVYPPDSKTVFTQADCKTGVKFRIETACFRMCKTQSCKEGIVVGKDADQLVYDCLKP